MAATQVFTPPNRLRAIVGHDNDPAVDALARAADQRLDALRVELRSYVVQNQVAIIAAAGLPDEALLAELPKLGAVALAICDVAGAAGLHWVGEAARGVYLMVAAYREAGVWNAEAIRVHARAMAIFSAEPTRPDREFGEIAASLNTMRNHLGVGLG